VNILNKQSRTTDRGWPSGLGVGPGANPHRKTYLCKVCTRASEMDGFSGMTQAPENGYEISHMECQEPL
jgi:hypothetical protein